MNEGNMNCPICGKDYPAPQIEGHVNKCLFLNEMTKNKSPKGKRPFPSNKGIKTGPALKKSKRHSSESDNDEKTSLASSTSTERSLEALSAVPEKKALESKRFSKNEHVPLAEKMRPTKLSGYVGQKHIIGPETVLFQLLDKREIPSMILWGPPGCGKTSLANVIAHICRQTPGGKMRYVKLSAAMSGVNDVKEAVNIAANELKFGRRTVMFMDEIHRFNKLQQDIFLPHIEAGTVTLIGATTENPSFSLNSALLSRCRVVVLEKLGTPELVSIIKTAVTSLGGKVHIESKSHSSDSKRLSNDSKSHSMAQKSHSNDVKGQLMENSSDSSEGDSSTSGTDLDSSNIPKFLIDEPTVQWLAETCDGDARIALGGLELAIQSKTPNEEEYLENGPGIITLEDIKESLKKTHMLYDRKGDQHYDIISALHKSVRASDENAALYWLARMMAGGEDPVYIARRLVRMSSEDVGLADPKALGIAVHTMHGCKMIGMPECDVLLAQCVTYLARAPKSRLMEDSLRAAQRLVANHKGPQPSVPLHLRNAPTKLMGQLGYGKGYNMLDKRESGLNYLPDGLEDVNFFGEEDLDDTTG